MPRLLDLFCGAGGAAAGYARAGFDVVGVDVAPQPHFPFEFVQMDALTYLRGLIPWCSRSDIDRPFHAIHASPPCQAFTAYKRVGNVRPSPNLIPDTRHQLERTGLPYVIENVHAAPIRCDLILCGSMFEPPLDVKRHRIFESNVPLTPPAWPCRHKVWGPDRFPGGRSVERTGSSRGLVRGTVEIGSWDIPLARQQEAMGIDWMTLEELSEAIPPAYTELIGAQLLDHLLAEGAA